MIVPFFHSSAVKSKNDREAIFWGIWPTSFGTMNEFTLSCIR